jgi:hypothetical protein
LKKAVGAVKKESDEEIRMSTKKREKTNDEKGMMEEMSG